MIADLMKSYGGVSCRWCGQPIPVSAKVLRLQEAIEHGDTNVPYTFVARCKLCEYESIYTIADIQALEGKPRKKGSGRRA